MCIYIDIYLETGEDGYILPLIMFSISVLESLPTALEIVMFALRPVDFSVAVTFRIPLTSTSNTTSRAASIGMLTVEERLGVRGEIGYLTPALMGGIGAKVNSPSEVLSSQLVRSPW